MITFNIIGIGLMVGVSVLELTLVLIHDRRQEMRKDMKANILLGILYLLSGLLVKGVAFAVFSFCYYYSFFKPGPSWWLWIVAFLSCDFMHYLYHWLGHKTRIFWAAHVTHHSSQFFNISTGYRNNSIHVYYRFLFWAPICFFGVPPEMVLFIESITAIQNFVVHTEKVGKLGVLDWLFNTPSNHRVHHGVNPEYIDKNLGGVTMIYDHIFGTYAKEINTSVYGITHNIHTHNPYQITVHEYVRMKNELLKLKGLRKKLQYLFSPPT